MTNQHLPKRLMNCPIVDALLEIRFTSNLNRSAVFGYIYSLLQNSYPGPVFNLPLSQIPDAIREKDPNLQFKPIYRIEGIETVLQIGPDMITLSSKLPYIGWDKLESQAIEIISRLKDKGAIDKVLRFGHRYINFFEGCIDERLNLSVNFVDGYSAQNIQIRSEVSDGLFTNTLQYSNSAEYRPADLSVVKKGSIIDIDTFRVYSDDYFLNNIKEEINTAHVSEKNLFYSLLKPDFIKELNPEY